MIKLFDSSVQCECLRLLSFVFVVRAHNNVQVSENFASQRILWKHSAYSIFYHSKRLTLHLLTRRSFTLATGVTCVPNVFFAVPFVSRQNNLLCIDYNNEVPTISMWCKVGLVLSTKTLRDFGCPIGPNVWPSASNKQPLLFCVLLVDGAGFVAQSIHSSVFLIVQILPEIGGAKIANGCLQPKTSCGQKFQLHLFTVLDQAWRRFKNVPNS